MPIYEYECPVHGLFDKIYPYDRRPRKVKCAVYDQETWEECGEESPIQVSAPTMKPDKHWAGTETPNGKYVTSQKEYDDDMKYLVPATRANREAMQSTVAASKQDKARKKEQSIERFLERELAGVAIDGAGGTVKERNRNQRRIRQSYSD